MKDSTATFTFSNRGEVETLEKMAVAFNKMDGEAYSKFFADSLKYYHSNGKFEKISNKNWIKYFDNTKSVNLKINGILPFKISDTDPISGIMVSTTVKWEMKDGTMGNRDQFVQYP